MRLIPQRTYMVEVLENLLEAGEVLRAACYGVLTKLNRKYDSLHVYIGLTDTVLLLAAIDILNTDHSPWALRLPLSIERVDKKEAWLGRQIVLKINLRMDIRLHLRIFQQVKAGEIGNQQEQIELIYQTLVQRMENPSPTDLGDC